jgi:hypothetical protein
LDPGWAEAEQAVREAVGEAARVGAVELERAEVCGKRVSPVHRLEGQEAVVELAAGPEAVEEAVEGQESVLERAEEADLALEVAALEVVAAQNPASG